MPNLDINRQRSDSSYTSYSYLSGGKWVDGVPYSTTTVSWYSTLYRQGGKTANFLVPKLRPSPLPANSFTFRRGIRNGLYGTVSYHSPTYRETRSGCIEPPGPLPAPPTGNAVDQLEFKLITSFFNRLADQKVNVAVLYGERDQTARLIGDTAVKIAAAIKSAKKGNVGAGLQILAGVPPDKRKSRRDKKRSKTSRGVQAVTDNWLAMQYGWKPLLSDCYGAAEQLAKSKLNLPPPVYLKQSRSLPFSKTTRTENSGTGLVSYETEQGALSKSVYACFTVEGSKSMLNSVGLANPATLAWELLPYSFVVDWFWSVGSWVNSFTATAGCSWKTGGITTFFKASRSTLRVWTPKPGVYYSGSISGLTDYVTVGRRALANFPQVPYPPYNDNSSVVHMLNGSALIASAINKK